MNELLQLDYQLFEWINGVGHNIILDEVFPFMRNKYVWLPLYIFLISFLLINFRQKGAYLLLFLLALIFVSDTVSSQVIKKSVQRTRPCRNVNITHARVLVHCGGGYSFTSSHATNHFALAAFLALTLGRLFSRIKLPLLLWAASIAYAQVYVGVHFPLDVVGGAVLGIWIAFIFYKLYLLFPNLHLASKI